MYNYMYNYIVKKIVSLGLELSSVDCITSMNMLEQIMFNDILKCLDVNFFKSVGYRSKFILDKCWH